MKRFLLTIPFIFAFFLSPVFAATTTTTVMTHKDAKLGTILIDSKGMSLYLFKKDTAGTSTCYDECASDWPPLIGKEPLTLPAGVPGKLTLVDRKDGTKQVAYNGMPLYYFDADKKAGDTNGQDIGDVWYVVNPSASSATPESTPEGTPTEAPKY